ncbi:RES domain-containing protein [Rothia sp. AR01]|uniref:RES domain-containing protein n=1 Tax=Rothia santali TaxID=2949643 RepID=A0A9X2HIL2_9MICC|nr:RES domain-containing protein [Rothia santali]MCP3425508.1 RES domain-containing protein [Rothia santali]
MRFRELARHPVWRVGYRPDPWSWPDWRWAGPSGRFNGRWDALDPGLYRTLYAGDSLFSCLVEVLAPFRPDPELAGEMGLIVDDEPTMSRSSPSGTLDLAAWLSPRQASTARLSGTYCRVTDSTSVAALYGRFSPRARLYGLPDFDASALKIAEPRLLTQEISQHLWEAKNEDEGHLCDGVEFSSRHGDDLLLWAVYERPGDPEVSPYVVSPQQVALGRDHPELRRALALLGITAA